MARRKSNPDEPKPTKATKRAQSKAVADLNEGINVEAFNKLALVYFKAEDQFETMQGEFMAACKNGPRAVQKNALDDAKASGLPMLAVKAKLKLMRHDRAKEKIRRALEPVDASLLNRLEKARKELGALADTELGKAHLEKLQQDSAEAVDALAGDEGKRPGERMIDAARDIVAGNVARLTGPDGIKQLEEPAA
jgi:hypothetical protein